MNLRDYEHESIRRFVQKAADDGYLRGRVLDYGCGKQPYRGIVEAGGGHYTGFDLASYPASTVTEDVGEGWSDEVFYDAVLCTQVVQYVPEPHYWIAEFRSAGVVRAGGHLVMTYPTNWPEVEAEDLQRLTKAGMERALTDAAFTIIRHYKRGSVWDPRFDTAPQKRVTATGEEFVLGYGVIARA